MLEETNDTILARWLSGEIGPQELRELEASENFGDYRQIVQGMDRFQKPPYNGEALKEKIQTQIDARKGGKLISFKPWHWGIAASVLLLFSLTFFFREVEHATLPGQQLTVSLPDGSLMKLNANTQVRRARFLWSRDKKIQLLQGEAYFQVERGEGFQVSTPQGSVEVLGTQFNVRSRLDYLEVSCYQGKVRFVEPETSREILLEKGQKLSGTAAGLRTGTMVGPAPPWLEGESVFENVPLKVVLLELEAQYGLFIETMDIDLEERYTGGFVHGNLEGALTTVLLPMGIQYQMDPAGGTLLLSPRD